MFFLSASGFVWRLEFAYLWGIPDTTARLKIRVHLLLALGLDYLHPLCWRLLIFNYRRWPDEGTHCIILSLQVNIQLWRGENVEHDFMNGKILIKWIMFAFKRQFE
jgi:hypothetical protein